MIEMRLGFPLGYISGDSTRLALFTSLINLTGDDYTEIAIRVSGKFQWDDSNYTDYPIITTNLVANQRDYAFTTDEDGNVILEIYRVFARTSTTTPYFEIFPVDVQSDPEIEISELADGLNITGTPTRYDKTANGIFVDPIPSANVTAGLKVYINREASRFAVGDTTKMPGVPGIHHEYYVVKTCFRYAKANNLAILPQLEKEVVDWEGSERLGVTGRIKEYFAHRSRDERKIMTPKKILYI